MFKYRVKLIVEGENEEYEFFDMVKMIGTHESIELDVESSYGYGEIGDAYLNAIRDERNDCVLCVYDVDGRANEDESPYKRTYKKLLEVLGDSKIVKKVSFCTNPNILQLFLLAADTLDKVALKTTSKNKNSQLVHSYWNSIASGAKDEKGRNIKPLYNASKWQIDIMKYSIINGKYPYENIFINGKDLSNDYINDIPASNVLLLLIALKNGDIKWFEDIQQLVDKIAF